MKKYLIAVAFCSILFTVNASDSLLQAHHTQYAQANTLKQKQLACFNLTDYFIEYDFMDSAQYWLNKAKVAGSQLPDGPYKYLLNTRQAEIYYYQNLHDFGLLESDAALKTAKQINDSLCISDALFFKGLFLLELKNPDSARQLLSKSLAAFPVNVIEPFPYPLVQRQHIQNNLCESFIQIKMPDSAKGYNDIALQHALANNFPRGISNVYHSYGEIFRLLKNYDSSLYYLYKCIDFNKNTPYRDLDLLCAGKLEVVYLALKKYDSARHWHQKAIALMKSGNVNISFQKIYCEYLNNSIPQLTAYPWMGDLPVLYKNIDSVIEQNKKNIVAGTIRQIQDNETQIAQLQQDTLKANGRRNLYITLFVIALTALAAAVLLMAQRAKYKSKMQQQKELLERKQVIEKERTRIATDMHDDFGVSLSRIKLLSEKMQVVKSDNETLQKDLGKISEYSGEMAQKMNEIIWALNQRYDTLEDLVNFCRAYAAEFLQDKNLQLHFTETLIGNPLVKGEIRRAVFLVLKEALYNITKHAAATQVFATFTHSSHAIELVIKDNGKGIDFNAIRQFANGISNMKKRIQELNGSFEIKNEGGTVIKIHVPL